MKIGKKKTKFYKDTNGAGARHPFSQVLFARPVKTLLISSYFAILLILSLLIFRTFTFLLIIWISIFLISILTKSIRNLSKNQKRIYFLIIFLYPLIEEIIKFFIDFNIIPYSWHWLNRLEHFFASFSFVYLFSPFYIKYLKNQPFAFSLVFIIGLVTIIGVGNEIFEYFIRVYLNLQSRAMKIIYYYDTIIDLIVNLFGALFGGILILLKKSKT